MTTRTLIAATAVLSLVSIQSALAIAPNASEMIEARRWAAAKLEGVDSLKEVFVDAGGMEVLANNDPVQVNCHNGKPLQIGEKQYTRGLYCHAASKVVVHLPSPGKMFRAVAGVNRNPQTVSDVATVVFSVNVGEKKVFQSEVMRVRTPGVVVEADLGGAKEFVLEVGDAGDGISCDQANWADARVTLTDGKTLWLADLPFVKSPAQANTYTTDPFFSFIYDGQPSADLLKTWKCVRAKKRIDAQKTEHTTTYTDPKTGLELRCIGTEFLDFPAVEWVVQLENKGKKDTPILESIQALDSVIPFANVGDPTLYWSKGGVATFDDFAPQEVVLKGDAKIHLQPGGGRSSNSVLPFFNVMNGCGGVISAVGWTGEWAANFARDPSGVQMKAGLARTHLSLHAGETIRTPRMLLIFYRPDRWRGQNLLRQFVLTHHRPMQNGKPLVAPITWGNWGGTTAEVHLDNIQKIIDHKLPIDYYWIDAGWYGKLGVEDWAGNAGCWVLKKDLYPSGMKQLSDLLEGSGRKLMLWFEPERVVNGTLWSTEHPEWMLKVPNGGTHLMNLGNPATCKFVTEFVSEKIKEFGLGCYRQDFNIDPLAFWQANDAENRQGMSEIRYIEGLYTFWDGLLARFPHLMIDNCASGGRRIDLETTSRATPYWRTDGPRDPVAHQCHSYGLMAWVPLSAISEDREGDTYEFRSSMCSSLCVNWFHSGDGPQKKMPKDFPFDWGKKILDEYLTIRHFYYGDYYPLTSYTQDQSAWLAWQFDRPEQGDGMVQVFRREGSPYESLRVTLRGLDPDAVYTLTNLDVPGARDISGRELLEKGLAVAIEAKPSAVVITYKKKS